MVVRRAYDKEFIFASLYPFVVDNSYTLPGWGSVGRAGAGWEEGRGGWGGGGGVFADKQPLRPETIRAQELCESRGGRPEPPRP